MKKLLIALLLMPTLVLSWGHDNIVLPSDENIIKKERYVVSYNLKYKIPNWVAYEASPDDLVGDTPRSKSWRSEKSVLKSNRAYSSDYTRSGYDRGHLVPAADMISDYDSMRSSFVLSNAAPQMPNFNRGIWKKLEGKVRDWTRIQKSIWIYTGVYFVQGRKKTIGKGVGVPHYWYKIIYRPPLDNRYSHRVVAFVFRNKKYDYSDFWKNEVTVDYIEKKTKLDFLNHLPDDIEKEIESVIDGF